MNEITEEWIFKAEEDFTSAGLLMYAGEAPVPDYVCFHCQQCAEKYLKAYLQEHEIEFERKHDLHPLLELCSGLDKEFTTLEDDIFELDRYAVAARYPGIILRAETAESALNAIERVRKFIRKKLEITHGAG
jgi:HEPN domain-containing protein